MNMLTTMKGLGVIGAAAAGGYYGYDFILQQMAVKEVKEKRLSIGWSGGRNGISSGVNVDKFAWIPFSIEGNDARNIIHNREGAPWTIHYLERCLRSHRTDKVSGCLCKLKQN